MPLILFIILSCLVLFIAVVFNLPLLPLNLSLLLIVFYAVNGLYSVFELLLFYALTINIRTSLFPIFQYQFENLNKCNCLKYKETGLLDIRDCSLLS